MKKLLLAALAVAVVLVGVAAVNKHYDQSKPTPKPTVAAKSVTTVNVEAAKKAQYQSDQKLYSGLIDKLQVECKKGEAAYNQLTTWGKTQVQEPNCPATQ